MLGPLARLLLRWGAEPAIADNPDHRLDRVEVQLGGRTVVLAAYRELRIWFHRLDRRRVSLDLVVDVTDLPD